jgi:hypothetical protein
MGIYKCEVLNFISCHGSKWDKSMSKIYHFEPERKWLDMGIFKWEILSFILNYFYNWTNLIRILLANYKMIKVL